MSIFNFTVYMLKYVILPVYVFDGKPNDIKNKTLENRKKIKDKAVEKLLTTLSDDEKIKYLKRSVFITKKHIDECKELLDYMGIPYIVAVEEADSEIAKLCEKGYVDIVSTEDMDILTFGSPKIVKNLFSKQLQEISIVNIKEIKAIQK